MKKVTDYVILFGMELFKGILLVCGIVLGGTASYAAGLLKAESFPGTFSDLSFQNRMALLAQALALASSQKPAQNSWSIFAFIWAGTV